MLVSGLMDFIKHINDIILLYMIVIVNLKHSWKFDPSQIPASVTCLSFPHWPWYNRHDSPLSNMPPIHFFFFLPPLSLLLVSVAQQWPWVLWSAHPFWTQRLSSMLLVNEQANLWLSVSLLPLIIFFISTFHSMFPSPPLSFFLTPAHPSFAFTTNACFLKGQTQLKCFVIKPTNMALI